MYNTTCRLVKDHVGQMQNSAEGAQAHAVIVDGHKVDASFEDIRRLAELPAKTKCLTIVRADLLDREYLAKLIDKIRQYAELSATPHVRVCVEMPATPAGLVVGGRITLMSALSDCVDHSCQPTACTPTRHAGNEVASCATHQRLCQTNDTGGRLCQR